MCSEREEGINYEDHCSNLYGGGAGRHRSHSHSGDEARAVGDRVFKSFSGAKLCDMAGYTCRFGHVYAPDGERSMSALRPFLPHRTALRVKTWWSFPATEDCSF